MTTIPGVTPSSAYGYNAPITSASNVAKTSDSGLAQTAVSLSAAGSIVATLGGGSSSPLTYDAAGLLNSLVQAGTAPTSAQTASTQATAQNSTNQGSVSTLSTSPTTSSVYNSSGSLQGLPSNTSANWASMLKANPSLASTVISDSINQGIVGTLSTTA
jgi:hypothetical protein